ncbi:acyltransferase [Kitasatospora sp. NBC_00070]|uniref:acyltransferase family protein n=1 Tax=Kitasatospora sp. NBC_00070 TaxID=2975962 RepID=UPI003246FD98
MRTARRSTVVPGRSRYVVNVPQQRRSGQPRPVARTNVPSANRYTAVDGLRGLAIISVLLYHTNWFPNGLFGVDAFFVLSGFLVTLLLIRELDRTGRIAIGRFYRRRAKRLLPGLLVTLLLVVLVALLFSPVREAERLRPEGLAALFQAANWAQVARGGAYWDKFANIDPLSAMWSLSITEQFYLVWPLVLVALFFLCRRSVRAAGAVTFLLFLAAAAVAPLMWDGHNADRLYLGTDSRAVGFAAGAVAAFVVHLGRRRIRSTGPEGRSSVAVTVLFTVLGTGALASVLWLSVKVDQYQMPWLYRSGGLAVVAVLVAVLTVALCHDRGPLARVFSFGPLVTTGQISYSLYLLHLPVYWVLQQHTDDAPPSRLFFLGGSITWVLAWLLHRFTERIRLTDWRVSRALPIITLAAVVTAAGAWWLPQVIEHRMRPAGKPVVLTLGDSFAEDLAATLYQNGSGRFAVVDGGISGCGVFAPEAVRGTSGVEFPTTDECKRKESVWQQRLTTAAPDLVVLHLGWDAAEQGVQGQWISPCAPEYRGLYYPRLQALVELVRREAPSARVLLMNERNANGAIDLKWGSCYNRQVEDFVLASEGSIHLLDLGGFLCPRGVCRLRDEQGAPLYPRNDGVHLAPAGKELIAPWFEDEIGRALAGPAPAAAPSPVPSTPEPVPSPSAAAPTSTPSGKTTPSSKPSSTKPKSGTPSSSRPAGKPSGTPNPG